MSDPIYEEILPGGGMWSMRIRRHRRLTLTALEAGANVSALAYRADAPLDRLNVPDTLKALHTAKLTRGHVLMSDMGHALLSITDDTLGWHDPLGGCSTAAHIEKTFGPLSYQDARNDFYRNARDNFLVELMKHGLGERDIVANVNFFSKVVADDAGRLAWTPDHSPANASITLRADTDVLLVLANCPHPMHAPQTSSLPYPRTPVRLSLTDGPPVADDDFCRNFRPENARALALSARLHL